jgi:Ca-activated chloride channel family protein
VLGLFLAWVLVVVAIARPQWVGEPIELPNTGRDLMLSLDLSGSMQIRDMQVGNRTISRVEAVKAIASDFTERRVGDRVGLILFGSKAYVQGLAIKRLRDRPAASRVLILLTDGQDTASSVDPMEAAALAAQQNVKVYTIGISRNLGTTSARGGEVDEALLRAIAEATGGEYFRARDPRELQAIYGIIDQLEPVEQDASTFRPRRSLGYWAMLGALVIGSLVLLTGGLIPGLSRSRQAVNA